MTFAADFPVLGLFWTLLWLYFIVAWLVLVVHVMVHVFRNDALGGAAKAGWILIVVVLPLIGVVAYTARHGDELAFAFGPSGRDRDAAIRATTDHGMGYGGRF